jgi:hypothetical protein
MSAELQPVQTQQEQQLLAVTMPNVIEAPGAGFMQSIRNSRALRAVTGFAAAVSFGALESAPSQADTQKIATPKQLMHTVSDYYQSNILSSHYMFGAMNVVDKMDVKAHFFQIRGRCNTHPNNPNLYNSVQLVRDDKRGHYEISCIKKHGKYVTQLIPRSRFNQTEAAKEMLFGPGIQQAGAQAADSAGLVGQYGKTEALSISINHKKHIADAYLEFASVNPQPTPPSVETIHIHSSRVGTQAHIQRF